MIVTNKQKAIAPRVKELYLSDYVHILILLKICSSDLQVSISLDVKKSQNPRMFFTHNEGTRDYHMNIGLQRGAGEVCREMVTYVVPSNVSITKNFRCSAKFAKCQKSYPLCPYCTWQRPIGKRIGILKHLSVNVNFIRACFRGLFKAAQLPHFSTIQNFLYCHPTSQPSMIFTNAFTFHNFIILALVTYFRLRFRF